MSNNISILRMEKIEDLKQISVTLRINEYESVYVLNVFDDDGILGLDIGIDLQDLIIENSKKFIESVLGFYQGKAVSLPVNLG